MDLHCVSIHPKYNLADYVYKFNGVEEDNAACYWAGDIIMYNSP